MGLISLKNKLFCNKKTSESNFSFKESFNALLGKAGKALETLWKSVPTFTSIKSKITTIASNAKKEIISQKDAFVKNAREALDAELEAAKKQFGSITDQVKELKTSLGVALTCPEAEANDPQAPVSNPTADTIASPSTNEEELINVSSDTKIKKQLENAKSQDLNATATAITTANNELSNKGIPEIRETVKYLSNPHPILNPYVEQLSYFQPISENVGESFFGYTVDKPTLQLAEWGSGSAKAVRTNTMVKIRKDVANEITASYTELNQKFLTNISNEFEGKVQSPPLNTAHNYHLAGDSVYALNHILTKQSALMGGLLTIFTEIVGEQIALINYLNPIYPQYKINNDYYTINNERQLVAVDKRNNIIRRPFDEINNDSLLPKQLVEA